MWEFTVSKQTGLANGQTAVWSVADEKFFDELAKDCTTKEEVVRKGYEWIVEDILAKMLSTDIGREDNCNIRNSCLIYSIKVKIIIKVVF